MEITETPQMTTIQLKKHYVDAIKYLDRNYAYFLTSILGIGRPEWSRAVPTAAVGLQKMEDKNATNDSFEFIFNPEFAAMLDVETMAFILAHETMHIVLNHLKLVDRYIDKDERYKLIEKFEKREKLTRKEIKTLLEQQRVARKFNIAADAVINDYLAMAGMNVDGFSDEDGNPVGIRGMNVIGEDAAFMTVGEVFDLLDDQEDDQNDCDSCDGSGQETDGEGNGTGNPCPDCQGSGKSGGSLPDGDGRGKGAIDSHDWMLNPDLDDMIADAIEKAQEMNESDGNVPADLQDKMDEEDGKMTQAEKDLQDSMRAGSEEGNMRQFVEVNGLSMAWVKLLKEIDPDMFKEPGIAPPPRAAWHRRPRKLGAFKDTNLPVYTKDRKREKKTNEKPAIVLALDYSSSIGAGDADRFATLARSIPRDRIKLFACTFTTSYRKFDIDNPHGGGSGGTSFDPIVSFIEKDVKPELNGKYPKAVVIITDGEAALRNTPTREEAESWLWLISPVDRAHNYYPASKTIGRRAMLTEYTNE